MSATGILYAIASVGLVSVVSLIGILTISVGEQRLRSMLFVLVSFAAGAMFGDAFIHLLPEAFQNSPRTSEPALAVLGGILSFFALEKFLRWGHRHPLDSSRAIHPLGYLNLIADGVHNLIDGMIIGASYLVSLPIGVATTLAVIFHEIPQEIGDFGILIHSGFTRRRALLFNFLSASLAMLGTLVALLVGSSLEEFSAVMLPFTAGGFIYIAGCDLVPELHKEVSPPKSIVQLGSMTAGIGLMLLLKGW